MSATLAVLGVMMLAVPQTPDPGSPRRFYVQVAAESLQVTVAGEGEPVVLVPGLFGSAYAFRHLLDRLPAAGYQAIVVEPLGIGTSGRPEDGDYSLTSQADRIAHVMRELRTGPAVLLAHSTGASMALRLAHRNPELVSAVVSIDGGPAERATSRGFRRAMQYVPWIKWLGGVKRVRAKIRESLVETSGDTTWVSEEVVDGYTAGPRADLDGTLKAYLRMAEAREPERLVPCLADVRAPVRLIIGTAPHEGGIPKGQLEALQRELASFAVDSVPGVGLHVHEERPEAVIESIRRARQGPGTYRAQAAEETVKQQRGFEPCSQH
jgi:pimeloyl-ACP methyl ester carboxylesterase